VGEGTELTWITQIFDADSAKQGGVVRRSRESVSRYATMRELVAEAKQRNFHVLETGGQVVILCHEGELVIHC
jgi:hypothetical protein